jgi:flagellin
VTVDGKGGTRAGASAALAAVTATTASGVLANITTVTASRATYGADMAAYASAVATMQTSSVNLSASYSRIMDTDYAAETTAMTRNNILQQAGTAVLAQANQTPNTVLSLLR